MQQKILQSLDFVEGLVALSVLVGVITLSVVGVIGLNPENNIKNTPNVAGVKTVNAPNISVKNLYNIESHEVQFESADTYAFFDVIMSNLNSRYSEYQWIEVKNNSDEYTNLDFGVNLKGYVQDILNIYVVEDPNNFIKIYPKNDNSLQLAPRESKILSLRYFTQEAINFPVRVEIKITAK